MAGVDEPILKYKFKVSFVPTAIDNINSSLIKMASDELGFNEINIESNESALEEYQEGGLNEYTHYFPKHARVGKLTLSHGLSQNSTLAMIRNMILSPKSSYEAGRFSMVISMYDHSADRPVFWYFMNVWPVSLKIDNLAASSSNSVAIEKLELAVTQMELDEVLEYNLNQK